MGYMAYLIWVTQRIAPKIWDPYAILDISRSATEKAIKKQYKKLTLIYHPDKIHLSNLNKTIEEATAYYVEISKAYKALTDEEIRNNYLQYGHPDGKQSFSIGIALPKLIVEDGAGTYVLLVYGILLGVLLPYVVGRWWYGTQRMTKEKVLVASAGKLFQEYKDDIIESRIVTALSAGEEYNSVLKGNKADNGLGKIEKAITSEGTPGSLAVLKNKDLDELKKLEGVRRKTSALLWAYLSRTKLDDSTLDDGKLYNEFF
jgi:translocation protein SEC63